MAGFTTQKGDAYMNYTKNHHLPQWEKTDRIMMEDFNAMCADMEAGLDKTARNAAADTAAARSESAAAAARAQSTADTAVSKADAAREVADAAYCPSYKPFVTGSYTGTDLVATTVTLGFRPSFLIISAQGSYVSSGDGRISYVLVAGPNSTVRGLTFQSDGFRIVNVADSTPIMNAKRVYDYIAFR